MSEIRIMGYSVRWSHYRYAEWIHFDVESLSGDFTRSYARELYDHLWDDHQNVNVVSKGKYARVIEYLALILRTKFGS